MTYMLLKAVDKHSLSGSEPLGHSAARVGKIPSLCLAKGMAKNGNISPKFFNP